MDDTNSSINSSTTSESDMSVQFLGINCLPTSHKKTQTDINENNDIGTSTSNDICDTNSNKIDSVLTVNQKTQTAKDVDRTENGKSKRSFGMKLFYFIWLTLTFGMTLKCILHQLEKNSTAISEISKIVERCDAGGTAKSHEFLDCVHNGQVSVDALIATSIATAFASLSLFAYYTISFRLLKS